MGAPALRIPVALDLQSLGQQTQAASDRVGGTLKLIAQGFTKLNGEVLGIATATASGSALAWSQSLTSQLLAFSTLAAGAVAAYKIIGGAIDITRDKLDQMVQIADKSRDATVSATFFQSFTAESLKLKTSVEDLEGALTHAFTATKDQSPVDLGKWEVGEERITDVEKALRVYNETLAKTQGQTLQGLVLFRDADTQEKKIVAVLEAMKQLNDLGQRAAALDLGERMFGAKFVDNIRQGKTSAEGMLETIKATSASSNNIFSDDIVKRAKDIDDQLKLAQQHLDREMKPTWESLANTMLTIKSLWADVVELIAKAAGLVGKINIVDIATFVSNPAGFIAGRVAKNLLGLNSTGNPAKSQLAADAGLNDIGSNSANSRGTGAAPTLKQTGTSRDRFETSADSIEKRTAATVAETAAIDLGTEARERAKIAAQLQAVAIQVNKEAGLGENIVTAEQRQRIDEVAAAYGRAAAAIENARSPLATFARESENVGKMLNQFAATSLDGMTNALASVVTGSKTAAQAFKELANSVFNDLARIAIRQSITGPIAKALGGFDIFNVGSIGKNASGTDNWQGGPTWVGEDGPEILNLPKGSQVIPNNIAMRGGSASPGVVYAPTYHFDAGIGPADMALIQASIRMSEQRTRGDVAGIMRGTLRNDRDYLNR